MKKALFTVALTACCCSAAFAGCSQNTENGLTKNQYSEIFGKTAEIMLGNNNSAKSTAKYEIDQSTNYIKSTGAFVYFLSELYKSDKFILSENPVQFTCSYGTEHFTISMLASYNRETGIVTGEILCNLVSDNADINPDDGYINISVDYDFDTETVNSFNIGQCTWDSSAIYPYFQSNVYSDGVIYTLSYEQDEYREAFISEITAKKEGFAEKLINVKTLDADFTEEYTQSMKIVTG